MQLRQVGVPVSVNPRSETHNLYQALEDILAELPAPVEPPRQAGAVLAIVGESTPGAAGGPDGARHAAHPGATRSGWPACRRRPAPGCAS